MLSRLQQSSRRARTGLVKKLAGAVQPVLQSLETRRLLSGAGMLDTSFNSTGYSTDNWGTSGGSGSAVAIQGDGKILVAGSTGTGQIGVARYLADGSPDSSFGTDGKYVVDLGGEGSANPVSISQRSDGKIWIAGQVFMNDGSTGADVLAVSLNGNGTPDASFGSNGVLDLQVDGDQSVGAAATKGDDLYVAGNNGNGVVFLSKFTTAGSDSQFDQDGLHDGFMNPLDGPAVSVRSISVQSDGKFVVAGASAFSSSVLTRLNANGTLDTNYGSGGVTNTTTHENSVFTQAQVVAGDKTVVVGWYGNEFSLEVQQYDADGQLDPNFNADTGSNGIAAVVGEFQQDQYAGLGLAVDGEGRILVTGYHENDNITADGVEFVSSEVLVARFKADGTTDTTFGSGGVTFTNVTGFDQGNRAAVQSDGAVVVVGALGADAAVLRYTADDVITPPATPVFVDASGNLVVPGTPGDDTFIVTSQTDGIHVSYNGVDSGAQTFAGVIKINGLAGNDSITVDAGVTIGTVINGGVDNDTISGGGGADSLIGSDGNDQISGNDGNDTLRGGNGDDALDGGAGNDLLAGGAGADFLAGGTENDTLNGGADNDTSLGGSGDDSVSNDTGDDSLSGGLGNDTLRCGAGNDIAQGNEGDDSLIGGTENDNLDGGEGNDTINGGAGDDTLIGGNGDDSLIGADGNDNLSGGDNNDTLSGGNGNDLIDGGEGDNNITGGNDNDNIVAGSGNDVINSGAGNDIVNAGDGNNSVSGADGDDSLTTGGGSDTISGGNGNDYISAGAGADLANGSGGNDIVVGGADGDTLSGGDGRDIVIGGTGADSVIGNAEDDILVAGTTTHDDNISELNAIMAEWSGGNTFAQRVANIRNGSGTASRANGSNFLNPDAVGLTAATVRDDGVKDSLTGNAGTDLFYFNNDGDGSTNDAITDFKAAEAAFDID